MEQQSTNAKAVFRACTSHLGIGPQQVISELTSTGPDGGSFEEDLERLHKEVDWLDACTVDRFIAVNCHAVPVKDVYNIGEGFTVLTDQQMAAIWRDIHDGWDRFRELYPESSGILEVSQIGFNHDENEALIYSGMQFGPLFGQGDYLHFKLTGNWKPNGQAMAWIS